MRVTFGTYEGLFLRTAGMSFEVVEVRASRIVFPRLGLREVIPVLPMLLRARYSPKNEFGLSSEPQATIEFVGISSKNIGA